MLKLICNSEATKDEQKGKIILLAPPLFLSSQTSSFKTLFAKEKNKTLLLSKICLSTSKQFLVNGSSWVSRCLCTGIFSLDKFYLLVTEETWQSSQKMFQKGWTRDKKMKMCSKTSPNKYLCFCYCCFFCQPINFVSQLISESRPSSPEQPPAVHIYVCHIMKRPWVQRRGTGRRSVTGSTGINKRFWQHFIKMLRY